MSGEPRAEAGQRDAIAPATVLSADDISQLPLEPLRGVEHVKNRALWSDGHSTAGLLSVPAGRSLGSHRHRVNHHHFWVLSGRAVVLGRVIGPGSYVHIPSGVEHDIDATDTEGCTVFYLYQRPG